MKVLANTISLFTEANLLIKNRVQRLLPLSLTQCQALWFIEQHDRPKMQDVAKYFKITAPSTTFLVDEMVRSGLVKRSASAKDRRQIQLELAPKGIAMLKTLKKKRVQILNDIFKVLSPSDRSDLDRILKKILAAH